LENYRPHFKSNYKLLHMQDGCCGGTVNISTNTKKLTYRHLLQ
jgi:hypothetical protein